MSRNNQSDNHNHHHEQWSKGWRFLNHTTSLCVCMSKRVHWQRKWLPLAAFLKGFVFLSFSSCVEGKRKRKRVRGRRSRMKSKGIRRWRKRRKLKKKRGDDAPNDLQWIRMQLRRVTHQPNHIWLSDANRRIQAFHAAVCKAWRWHSCGTPPP